ncbi:MAG: hypothetical protein ACTSWY_12575 [Promethearchaeota archaeon]
MLKKTKTTILFAVLLIGTFISPSIGAVSAGGSGIGGFNFENMDEDTIANMPQSLSAGLGQVFGMFRGLGPSGAALGQILSLLLGDIANLSIQDSLIEHVYVLNASYTQTNAWNRTFSGEDYNINWIWKQRYGRNESEYPYVIVNKTGTISYTHTYGASVVFIIWDNDDSFITALQKVIDAFQTVMNRVDELGRPKDWNEDEQKEVISLIVGQVLNAISYLLIHINDIINGDELITTNIITWDSFSTVTSSDFAITKSFRLSNGDGDLSNDTTISKLKIDLWRNVAEARNDEYMLWLLDNSSDFADKTKDWSHFTFNLIEIWLKNFEIHINAQAIVDRLFNAASNEGFPQSSQVSLGTNNKEGIFGDMAIYEIFQGLDIEIYLMTHSLRGFIGYNDTNDDGVPNVEYNNVTEDGVNTATIKDSEAEYWFVLGDLGEVIWNEPELIVDDKGIKKIQWSVKMNDPKMAAVPIGLGPDTMESLTWENLDHIEMGFTFTPILKEYVDTEGYTTLQPEHQTEQMAHGLVKLDQYFGIWNDGNGPNNADLIGMDFAVIFISTMTHFHVHFDVNELTESPETAKLYEQAGLLEEGRYTNSTDYKHGMIKVGRYSGDLPLAYVDIAGPAYQQDDDPTTPETYDEYNASTCTIPLAFFEFDAAGSVQQADATNPTQSFEASGFVNLESSVMIYAVNYPTWKGSGDQIWHDPTFSVFMTWDNPGFWAVILVIGGVTLVAVAALMITKRKNRI